MHQLLTFGGRKRCSDLKDQPKRVAWIKRSIALNLFFYGDPIDQFHYIEILVLIRSQVVNRSNIRVTQAGSRTSLTQKLLAGVVVPEKSVVDDLQGHRAL